MSGGAELKLPPVCPYCKKEEQRKAERNGHGEVCQIYTKFEEVQKVTGTFGRYQIYLCVLLLYSTLMWEGNLAQSNYFGRHTEKMRCGGRFKNITEEDPEFCEILPQCRNENQLATVGESGNFRSIIQEWNLVCSETNVVQVIAVAQNIAMFLGAIISGSVGDRFGRKRYLYAGQYGFCITAVLSVASTDWVGYAVANSIMSFFYAVVEVTGLTLALESTDSTNRLLVNMCFQSAGAYIIIAPIAYVTKNWRMYLITINFLTSPLLLGYLLVHESPRWVIQQGLLSRGAAILTDIGSARWNRRETFIYGHELRRIARSTPVHTKDPVLHPEKLHKRPRRTSVSAGLKRTKLMDLPTAFPLFLKPYLRSQSLLLCLALIAESWIHHAFHAEFDEYVENVYLATMLTGFVHLWVPVMVVIIDRKCVNIGRRHLFLFSLGLMIVCYGGITITHMQLHVQSDALLSVARIILTMVGDGCRQSAFILAIDQITVEFYPTVLRCTAVGTFTAIRYLNSVFIEALILALSPRVPESSLNLAICIVADVFAVFCWILSYAFQCETKALDLRETLKDCEAEAERLKGLRKSSQIKTSLRNVKSSLRSSARRPQLAAQSQQSLVAEAVDGVAVAVVNVDSGRVEFINDHQYDSSADNLGLRL